MGFSLAIVQTLATAVESGVTGLERVYAEWPEQNEQLVFPSVTIMAKSPTYSRCPPYLVSQEEIEDEDQHDTVTTYCVGDITIPLQIDIWTKYKVQRDEFLQKFFDYFENPRRNGLNLQLADYFDEWTNYTILGYRFPDDAQSVGQKEWRAIVDVVATCRTLNTTRDYIMTQSPVLVFEIPDNIPNEES